jgi:hypothetical protein
MMITMSGFEAADTATESAIITSEKIPARVARLKLPLLPMQEEGEKGARHLCRFSDRKQSAIEAA